MNGHFFTTYREMLAEGEKILLQASCEEARTDSWWLFSYLTGMERAEYFLKKEEKPSEHEQSAYRSMIEKRSSHIPLQYITGEQEFMGFPFYVNENVLIPRQDTEILVETVLPYIQGKKVLDLCTGSGCIAISLALLGEPVSCVGTDISSDALETAERNRERNGADVSFFRSNLFEKIEGTFDVIVSNPPYIPTKDVEELQEEVRGHEPFLALDGGSDGLYYYRNILKEGKKFLRPGGFLFFEIGHDEGDAVCNMMWQAGFFNVICKKDYAGLDRVVYGKIEMEENNV